MTKPKRWPTNAEWARLEAISEAQAGIREAEPALMGEATEPGHLIRIIGAMTLRFFRIVDILRRAREGREE